MTAGAGWPRVPIGEVADVALGKTPKKHEYRSAGRHRLFKYRDIQNGELVFGHETDGFVDDDPQLRRGLRSIEVGDILVGASGHSSESIGRKVARVSTLPEGGPHYYAGELLRVRPIGGALDGRWLYHYLASEAGYKSLQEAVSGVHLTNGRARQMPIPLPPLAEQLRICPHLDVISSNAQVFQRRVISATKLLRRTRQSILRAACSGELTGGWRVRAAAQMQGNRQGEQPEAELPYGWRTVRVSDVASVFVGGTPARQRPDYWGGGVPWVSSGEVANGRIASTRETISQLGLRESSAKIYPIGTVLIAMIGEGKTRGQAAILDIEASTNQNVAGLIARENAVDPEYLWRWALAQYESTRAAGRGGNQSALNKRKVGDLEIKLPPLMEQREIVARIDELLKSAELAMVAVSAAARLGVGAADLMVAEHWQAASTGVDVGGMPAPA